MTSMAGQGDLLFADALQRINFVYFLKMVFSHLHGGQLLKENWHHEAITFELELVRRRLNRRLIVNLPPRSLKSEMVSVAWVAWMLGRNPKLKFTCVSYSDDLASDFARQCLAILESDWYRRMFPGTILSRRATMNIKTTAGGGRLATSIEGSITGRGGDINIIDDPGKPEEALSEAMRAKVISWFRSTMNSRLNDQTTGSFILVMQRLHQEDLAGHLLEKGGWRHLSLPAIATKDENIPLLFGRMRHREIGDVLHPAHTPLAELERLKKESGAYIWSSQYQQEPVSEHGFIVKRDWLRYYDPAQSPQGRVVQSWDTASKTGLSNDWSACVTAVIDGNKVFIIDVLRNRWEFPGLLKRVISHSREFNPSALLVEDMGSGQELCAMLRNGNYSGVPFPIACRPRTDKRNRFNAQASRFESGQVFLPQSAPWLDDFVEEIVAFPGVKHDDQADALSQLLNWHGRSYHEFSEASAPYIPPPDPPGGDDSDVLEYPYDDEEDDDLEVGYY